MFYGVSVVHTQSAKKRRWQVRLATMKWVAPCPQYIYVRATSKQKVFKKAWIEIITQTAML